MLIGALLLPGAGIVDCEKMATIEEHRAVQRIAKEVLSVLADTITPVDTERRLADRAVTLLAERGITQTWYYQCPALVLLGSRSCLSISGREYQPRDERIGEFNLITVDLSPLHNRVWGDCARSFCIEDGRFVASPVTSVFREGLAALKTIHDLVTRIARPEMTFEDLFYQVRAEVARWGFRNLDLRGNVGHSFEEDRGQRRYVEAGNRAPLNSVRLFTIEPHLQAAESTWGFKHEEIYYFSDAGMLAAL